MENPSSFYRDMLEQNASSDARLLNTLSVGFGHDRIIPSFGLQLQA